MEKPISVKVKEFKEEMVSLVNKSGLPFFVIEPVIKDLLIAVTSESEKQYLRDKATYEQSLKQEVNELVE